MAVINTTPAFRIEIMFDTSSAEYSARKFAWDATVNLPTESARYGYVVAPVGEGGEVLYVPLASLVYFKQAPIQTN